MFIRQPISIGNLLLDLSNYRIVKQKSQKDARDAIITEQGRKLVNLAKDIIENGLNPFDLPLVVDAEDGNSSYIVIEGNRRLTAINLVLKPEQAEGTAVFASFKKLNREHADAIPKVIECMIAPSKKAGLIWINRKHQSGMEGAGTEPWTAMAKARADEEQGVPRADLDAVNFVLTNENLEPEIRTVLIGSNFNLTSLKRLVETKEVQSAAGFSMQAGRLVTDQDENRMRGFFTDIVKAIATGKHNGEKFTERNIDSQEKRLEFAEHYLAKHPKAKKAASSWQIAGVPQQSKKKTTTPSKKGTPSTDDQVNLIPRKFRLELPAGKINDIFIELKELDATKRRHAVSVLVRVFFEFTLENYLQKHSITLPVDKNGNPKDSFINKLIVVKDHAVASKLMTKKELIPINTACHDADSFLAPSTLNAYVHSQWMNPDPTRLKLTWASFQLFIERLWTSK